MSSLQARIEQKLTDSLNPVYLNVVNQSHLHSGHSGDDGSGESHFKIEIDSPALRAISKVLAHKKIYNVLSEEMKVIHALAIHISNKK